MQWIEVTKQTGSTAFLHMRYGLPCQDNYKEMQVIMALLHNLYDSWVTSSLLAFPRLQQLPQKTEEGC